MATTSVLLQVFSGDAGAFAPRLHATQPGDRRLMDAPEVTRVRDPWVGSGAHRQPSRRLIVDRVRLYIFAHIGERLTVDQVVAASAVSESTLRRALQAETGQHLVQFITAIKLDQAHAWLSTDRESRTQAQLAAALGFTSAVAFGRSYRHRFGEGMSVTRQRAVQMSGNQGVNIEK